MEIIYRKSDLEIVGSVTSNMTAEQEIIINVIRNKGGTKDDYDYLDVSFNYFKLERIDGAVVAIEVASPPEPPKLPTIEDLKQENEMLQASVMELSTIVATQEASQKILEQSVLELSTLLTTP
ncbi:hypothetical protein [Cytobacillus praedii]|uniref:hypothetical protein n=1 Tax=Cytobacillus praedii TaxID=1742358 RepID=UPI002E23B87B|nr:hypothetical protein [Cytobacillus praedii]